MTRAVAAVGFPWLSHRTVAEVRARAALVMKIRQQGPMRTVELLEDYDGGAPEFLCWVCGSKARCEHRGGIA